MLDEGDDLLRRSRERVGTLLKDKWRLDRLLGIGGMAAVYEASHRNGKRAAVKILHVERSIDRNIRSRFLREGYVANKVNHPGAVSILDDDATDDGAVFLVMELLEGESLQSRLAASPGGLPPAAVLSIADQVLAVLEAAHAQGVVHRDLKPDNLFLTTGGVVKVLDFGIARLRELTTKSNATGSSASLGTPAFMPPEQARGRWELVDAKSDLWAVGATLFTLLTGRHVHEAPTVNEHLLAAMTMPAPKLAAVSAGLPEPVCSVVDKALAFDRDKRWATATEMRQAMQKAHEALEGAPIPVVVPGAPLASSSSSAPVEAAHDATTLVKGPSTTAATAQVTTVDSKPRTARPRTPVLVFGAAAVVAAVALLAFWVRSPDPATATGVSSVAAQPSASTQPAATSSETAFGGSATTGQGSGPPALPTPLGSSPTEVGTSSSASAGPPASRPAGAPSTSPRASAQPAAAATAAPAATASASVRGVSGSASSTPSAPSTTSTSIAPKPTTDPLAPDKNW